MRLSYLRYSAPELRQILQLIIGGILLLCLSNAAHTAPCDMNASYKLAKESVLLIDTDKLCYRLTSDIDNESVATLEQQPWDKATKADLPYFRYDDYWFRLKLENTGNLARYFILNYDFHRLGRVEVLIYSNNKLQNKYLISEKLPFTQRPIQHRNFHLPLTLIPNETTIVYFKGNVRPKYFLDRYYLNTQEYMAINRDKSEWIDWMFIGVTSILIIQGLITYSATRLKDFFYFVAYCVTLLLYIMASQGWGFQFLWPSLPWLETRIDNFSFMLTVPLLLLITIDFINLPQSNPLLAKRLRILIWILLGFSLTALLCSYMNRPLFIATMAIKYIVEPFTIGYILLSKRKERIPGLNWFSLSLIASFSVTLAIGFLRITDGRYSDLLFEFGYLIHLTLLAIAFFAQLEQLRIKEQRAIADQEAKTTFLTRMSHEIRTPMNGILGMSELLRATPLNNIQRQYNDLIYSSGSSLLTIINDILDYSKFSSGKLVLNAEKMNLRVVTQDCMQLFKTQAAEKNIHLYADIDDDVPECFIADGHRLRQMLVNLLSNAIKFSPSGEVIVRIRMAKQSTIIEITDSGPGIQKNKLSSLFKAFEQIDPGISSRYGGTGLGLVITKQLAEAMQGTIDVENQTTRGSLFRLTLPLEICQPNDEQCIDITTNESGNGRKNLVGIRALIASDNRGYAYRITSLCNSWQMNATLCEHIDNIYSQALNAALANNPYTLFLLDLNSKNYNVLDIAKQISEKLSSTKAKIILITDGGKPPEKALLTTAGISLQIERPFILQQLEHHLNAAMLGTPPENEDLPTLENHYKISEHPLNILVVEDNKTNQLVIRQLLRRLGHRCHIVENGTEGLNAYKSHGDSYDLILMDCEMPVMNGLDCTRKIRDWEADNNGLLAIPIVALTAHALPEKLQECIDAGMNNYLTKPLMLDPLSDMLEKYCDTNTNHLNNKTTNS